MLFSCHSIVIHDNIFIKIYKFLIYNFFTVNLERVNQKKYSKLFFGRLSIDLKMGKRVTNQRKLNINRNRIRRFRYSRKNKKTQKERDEREPLNRPFYKIGEQNSVSELLRAWVNCYAIPVRAVSTLLKILIIAGMFFFNLS